MNIDNISKKIESFTDEEFKSLKTQFHLINSYAEKLKFWELHFPYSHTRYFEYCNKVVKSAQEFETISDADKVSVFPLLKKSDRNSENYKLLLEERKQYFEWIEPKLIEYSFSFRKLNFLEDLDSSANRNEFLDWFKSNLNDEVSVLKGVKSRVLHSSFYQSKKKGYEGLVHNKKIDYTDNSIFDNFDEIQNFIDGRNLALFKNFIDNFDLSSYKSSSNITTPFTIKEKLLILTFYQERGDFLKYNSKTGQSKVEYYKLISMLTGLDHTVIKEAYAKVDKVLNVKHSTKGSAPSHLKSLETIKSYFESIKNFILVEKVENLMSEIRRKSMI